jgi:hypothetical protein
MVSLCATPTNPTRWCKYTNAKNYILFVGILFGNNLSLERVGNDRNCKSDTIIETYTKRNQEHIPEHVFLSGYF